MNTTALRRAVDAEGRAVESVGSTVPGIGLGEIPWGQLIRAHREVRRMRQRELAERCDMNESMLCRIEKNVARPSASTLERICKALELSIGELSSAPRIQATEDRLDGVAGDTTSDIVRAREKLSDLDYLAQAVSDLRRLSHAAILHIAPGPNLGPVDEKQVKELHDALYLPLGSMSSSSLARARLCHEQGKLRMFFGNLVAVEKIRGGSVERDNLFEQAKGMFQESLRIKDELGAKDTHVLPTMLQLRELETERLYWRVWGEPKHRPLSDDQRRIVDTQLPILAVEIREIQTRYEAIVASEPFPTTALRAAADGCRFLDARVKYLEAKSILPPSQSASDGARERAANLLHEVQMAATACHALRLEARAPDGAFWALCLGAKSALRLVVCDESERSLENAVNAYLCALSVDRSSLWNLKSLCFLESLHRDLASVALGHVEAGAAAERKSNEKRRMRAWAEAVRSRLR